MTEHTPGPWIKSPHSNLIKAGDLTICVVMERDDKAVEAANIRLIETAPQLLEALERLADWASVSDDGCTNMEFMPQMKNARMAIAKARSETDLAA